MRALIACGGTGGHITPGIAIARIIRENYKGAEILFLGAEGGMEAEMVARAGFQIRLLPLCGLSRRLSPSNLRAFYLTVRAIRALRALFCEERPDIVIGTGGYVCYPALHAAAGLGIPTAVHESNAVPGLAVRRLAPEMGRVWLNFAAAADALPKHCRTHVVGNPVLPFGTGQTPCPEQKARGAFLLSFGGSLGASVINRQALALMMQLRARPEIRYVHATGKREFEAVQREFLARGLNGFKNLVLLPFITDMQAMMAQADLVICRAGAISISELAALGRAAILLPSPNVTGDHQRVNARTLANAGAALYLEETVSSGELWKCVDALLADPARRLALGEAIRGFYRADSNALILRDIRELCRKG